MALALKSSAAPTMLSRFLMYDLNAVKHAQRPLSVVVVERQDHGYVGLYPCNRSAPRLCLDYDFAGFRDQIRDRRSKRWSVSAWCVIPFVSRKNLKRSRAMAS